MAQPQGLQAACRAAVAYPTHRLAAAALRILGTSSYSTATRPLGEKKRETAAARAQDAASDAENANAMGQIKASPDSFDARFSASSFVRTGGTKGRVVPAKIIDMNRTHYKLDLGTKFYSYIPRMNLPLQVLVKVKATDYTEHVTGDSKSISIFEGDVTFVQPLIQRTAQSRQQ